MSERIQFCFSGHFQRHILMANVQIYKHLFFSYWMFSFTIPFWVLNRTNSWYKEVKKLNRLLTKCRRFSNIKWYKNFPSFVCKMYYVKKLDRFTNIQVNYLSLKRSSLHMQQWYQMNKRYNWVTKLGRFTLKNI